MLLKPINLLLFYATSFFLVSWFLVTPAKSQLTSKQVIDLKNIKTLQAELQINAGTFKLTTQDQRAVNASFNYTRKNWKPEIKFTPQAGKGILSIKQPEEKNTNMQEKERNEWEIKMPRSVPTDLKFRMGAGEGTVNLSGAKVNRLEMEAGAGDFKVNLANTSVANLKVSAGVGALTLNLTGNRTNNLKAEINGGIGDLNLVLPRQTGVRVKVSGLGDIESGGLKKQGGYFVNDAYGKTSQLLDITVSAGLGSIKIQLEK
ncbi:lipoprotein [Adhaeribacter aerolatus]|uniref:Lipoprotein n=1 Tax=Adhaeribacter aerolatus TaxID=670289 RepID=A0A512AXY1_9BACT|nr:toast rack family protein [Adhaeribacter aerolatus]GEO04564.1 lipoprotein [Adhaeribacter aerolatus]